MPFPGPQNAIKSIPYVQRTSGAGIAVGEIGGVKDLSDNSGKVTPYVRDSSGWKAPHEGYVYTGSEWDRVSTGFYEFVRDGSDVLVGGTQPYADGWIELVPSIGHTGGDPMLSAMPVGLSNVSDTATIDASISPDVDANSTIGQIRIVVDMETVNAGSTQQNVGVCLNAPNGPTQTVLGVTRGTMIMPLIGTSGFQNIDATQFYGTATRMKYVFDSRASSWGFGSMVHWANNTSSGESSAYRADSDYPNLSVPNYHDHFAATDSLGNAWQDNRVAPIYTLPVKQEQLPGESLPTIYNTSTNGDFLQIGTNQDGVEGFDQFLGKKIVGTWKMMASSTQNVPSYRYRYNVRVYVKPA